VVPFDGVVYSNHSLLLQEAEGGLLHFNPSVEIGVRKTFVSLGSCCLAGRPWGESLSHPLQNNRKSHKILKNNNDWEVSSSRLDCWLLTTFAIALEICFFQAIF